MASNLNILDENKMEAMGTVPLNINIRRELKPDCPVL
jgi:hypothetical protein